MSDLGQFDFNNIEAAEPFLPAGTYPVILTKAEVVKKASGSTQFEYELQVIAGRHQNRSIKFLSENLVKKDGSQNPIGLGKVKKIGECLGVAKLSNTADLLAKKLLAVVGVEPADGDYAAKNKVSGFKPYAEVAVESDGSPKADGTAGGWAAKMGD